MTKGYRPEYAIDRLTRFGEFIKIVSRNESTPTNCASCGKTLVDGYKTVYFLDGSFFCVCFDCHTKVVDGKEIKSISESKQSMRNAVKEFKERVKYHV